MNDNRDAVSACVEMTAGMPFCPLFLPGRRFFFLVMLWDDYTL